VASAVFMALSLIATQTWAQQQSGNSENTNPGVTTETKNEAVASSDPSSQSTEAASTTTAEQAPETASAAQRFDEPRSLGTTPDSHDPLNYVFYKPLWAVSNGIGDFNPIGHRVSTPLESAIPGFRFKGFINNLTQINTTGNQLLPSGLYKDWRLQKQEERVQLEFRYQASEHLELVSVNHFMYDGAYSWQDSKGLQLNGSSNEEYYTQGKRIFREAYLRGNYGRINFTLGRQIINWGKLDGKIIDFINADDQRDTVQYHEGDYDWRYIGQLMGYLSLRPAANTTVSFVYNPDFQTIATAQPGSPWSGARVAPVSTYPVVKPSGLSKFGDSEYGVRVDQSIGALTIGAVYYTGFNRNGPDPNTHAETLAGVPLHFSRVGRYAYAVDYNAKLLGHTFIVRSEGLYTQNTKLLDTVRDEIVKKDEWLTGSAIETQIGAAENQYTVMYEYEWLRTPGIDGQRTGQNLIHVLDVSHSIRSTSDRANVEVTFYVPKGGSYYGGWSGVYAAGWKFNDAVRANVSYNDYQGGTANTYQSFAPFGVFRAYKNVQIGIKYEW
jgi:hypothetical protein